MAQRSSGRSGPNNRQPTTSSPLHSSRQQQQQQERPQFHNLDGTYDDACDFGKFALNPCGYLFETIANCAPKLAAYLQQHLAQIVYMFLVFGSWTVVFLKVYPLITVGIATIPPYHKNIGRVVFILCIASWRFAATTCPGDITKNNISKYDNYAYDGWLYQNNNICPTLFIRKLARSKYCRYSSRHVPRYDHYCIWLDNAIGEENYRVFILFLVVHLGMCAYGSVVLFRLLYHLSFAHANTSSSSNMVVVVFQNELAISLTLLFMMVVTGLLVVFLGFHLLLISRNTTTNEYKKWKEIKSWHKQATSTYQKSLQQTNGADDASSSSRSPTSDEENVRLVNTNPGPMPTNAYDMGRVANIYEVFFPRCLRGRKNNRPHKE